MIRRLLVIILVLVTSSLTPAIALAVDDPSPPQGLNADVRSLSQEDTDADGRPNVTTIDASFVTDHDRVTVYDGGQDMIASDRWWEATDFTNDTWVFDVGADGSAQLIIQFRPESGHNTAYLWDDVTGDGAVAYRVVRNQVTIQESVHWTLRVQADGDWTMPDGSLNYNFTALLDGCGICDISAATGGEAGERTVVSQRYPARVRALLRLDGVPDFAFQSVDANGDGIPEYTVWRMLTRVSEADYGFKRFLVYANEGLHRPAPPEGYLFWPLLGGRASGNYFDTPPFIPFNARQARVDLPRLGGYPIEQGYHINSYAYAPEGESPTYLNFENPMAYYDLAGDHDGLPELHIRIEYGDRRDPVMLGGQAGVPLEEVRYSWNQSNRSDLTWDYKVGLAGRRPIDQIANLGSLQLRTVPYQELPTWVVDGDWDVATFVANETRLDYRSSEGIYTWPAKAREYLAGFSSQAPTYDVIERGLRGEYSRSPGQPWLYFSPVDGRLHLLGASHGVYNVGGTLRVEYGNQDGDGYIDTWTLYEGGEVTAELLQVPGGLIYSAQGNVSLLQADIAQETFRTLPPTSHDAWEQLGEQLNAAKPAFAAHDLLAMFNQFTGERFTISGATLRDFRFTDDGYRFVLDLQPGYDLGTFPISGVSGPGSYVVTFSRESTVADAEFAAAGGVPVVTAFAAAQATGPELTVTSLEAPSSAQTLTPVDFTVRLANGGTEDAPMLPLLVTAQLPGRRPAVIQEKAVQVNGGEQKSTRVSWTPPIPGDWTITATLYLPGGATSKQSVQVSTTPVAKPSWTSVITAGWPSTVPAAYVVALLGLIALPTALGLLAVRGRG